MMQRYSYSLSEETNVARLGLISVMTTRPTEFDNGWVDELTIGNIPGRIKCRTQSEFGVPHGTDNDVSAAIHTMYILQGCPANGKVTFTLADILEMIRITPSQKAYARILESIKRLHLTHYEIEAHWFNADRKISGSTAFNYLSNYSMLTVDHPINPNQKQANFTVTLNDHVRSNLELRHIVNLQPEILKNLAPYGPTIRATYRLLQSVIHDPRNITIYQDKLRLSTSELKNLGRILTSDDRPSRILRFFKPPFEQLQSIGYITSIDISKGKHEWFVDIQFPQIQTVFSAEAYALLINASVWKETARELAASKSVDQIKATIEKVKNDPSVKNQGAMIAMLLRNDAIDTKHTTISVPSKPRKTKAKTIEAEPTEPIKITFQSARFHVQGIKGKLSEDTYDRLFKLVKEISIPSEELRSLIADPSDMAAEQLLIRYSLL